MSNENQNFDTRIVVSGGTTLLTSGKTYTMPAYTGNGGAVDVRADGTLKGNNATFQNNEATKLGGALYTQGVVNLENIAFVANTAYYGGAINNDNTDASNTLFNMTGGTFSDNSAALGGAFYNQGEAHLTGFVGFTANTASSNGGAIYNNINTNLTIESANFTKNAAESGGAIFNAGNLTLGFALFDGNIASEYGGAIKNGAKDSSATLIMAGGTFTRNYSANQGGAIFNSGTIAFTDDVLFIGNTSRNNYAVYNYGSGTFSFTKKLTMGDAQDIFCNVGTLDWDITGGPNSYASFYGFNYLSNIGALTITVNGGMQQEGTYTIAHDVEEGSIATKQNFTLKGTPQGDIALSVGGGEVAVDGYIYELTRDQEAATLQLDIEIPYLLTSDSQFTGGGAIFTVNDQQVITTAVGKTVTVTAKPITGMGCTEITSEDVTLTQVEEGIYTFEMPEKAVNVTVSYEATQFFVNSNYTESSCGGHVWGVNAFASYTTPLASSQDKEIIQTGGSFSSTAFGFHATTIEAGYNQTCYGGLKFAESTATGSATNLKITGGTVNGVFCGCYKNITGYNEITCDTQLTISGGTIIHMVAGADRVTQGLLEHTGSVTLAISGGEFKRQVFGGIFMSSTAMYAGLYGDINVEISGGTFAQSLYCGNAAATEMAASRTYVVGDINLTIDVSQNQVKFETLSPDDTSDICLGSFRGGWIDGKVSVTLTGNGENLSFDRTLLGASSGAYYYRDPETGERCIQSYVTKSRTLTIDDFQGNFDGLIKMFTTCNLKNDSAIAFTHANSTLADVATWNLEWGSSISGLVNNDFKGDTLNFDLTGWDENVWDVMGVTSSASGFKNFETATVSFKIGDVTEKGEWNGSEFVSDSFKAYTEDKTLKVAKLA